MRFLCSSARFVVPLLLLALAACSGGSGSSAPDIGLQVRWLTQPTGDLPTDVAAVRICTYQGDSTPDDAITSRGHLTETADGRFQHIVDRLPTGVPLRIRVEGLDDGGNPLYAGIVGPLVLQPGQRRYVNLAMYGAKASTVIPGVPLPPRFLHTATALPDGRVLIAGGFDQITPDSTCPSSAPAGSHCFDLQASSDAFVFDPSTADFAPVQGGMLQARGGQTATALPDGRVLIAGGAERAVLVLTPSGTSTVLPTFVPMTSDGTPGSLATFERSSSPMPTPSRSTSTRTATPGAAGSWVPPMTHRFPVGSTTSASCTRQRSCRAAVRSCSRAAWAATEPRAASRSSTRRAPAGGASTPTPGSR